MTGQTRITDVFIVDVFECMCFEFKYIEFVSDAFERYVIIEVSREQVSIKKIRRLILMFQREQISIQSMEKM